MEQWNIDDFIKNNRIKHIYIDIDGVLWHSCSAVVSILNSLYKCKTDKGSDVLTWNFEEVVDGVKLTPKDIEEIFASDAFFNRVKWIDGAKDFLGANHNANIKLVTKGTCENIAKKRKVISSLFDYYSNYDNIIGLGLNESKGFVDMGDDSLFIDDCVDNLKVSNARYKVLFCEYDDDKDREWQLDWHGLRMYDWNNIYDGKRKSNKYDRLLELREEIMYLKHHLDRWQYKDPSFFTAISFKECEYKCGNHNHCMHEKPSNCKKHYVRNLAEHIEKLEKQMEDELRS